MPRSSLTDRQRLGRELFALREQEVVNHPERRWRVVDTVAPPYRWVCHLDITYTDPGERYAEKQQAGTGVLISARHVLTAAHNLLSEDGRMKAVRVAVTPGRNGTLRPFGAVSAKQWVVHPSWVRAGRSDRDFDYGLITLDAPVGARRFSAIGDRPLGFWGDPTWGAKTRRSVAAPETLGGITVNIAGYPGDKTPGTQWRGDGRIRGPMAQGRTGAITAKDRLMLHTVDTTRGQSGGPVWALYTSTGERHLLGIHVAPAPAFSIDGQGVQRRTHNLALRLTAGVAAQLASWM